MLLDTHIFLWLISVCSINLKTLLGKTFRLFSHQKVPDIGVIGGGKFRHFFPEN
ncbi:unknown protein [Microcystis aeruginosa NIES-843]|uniref:Uncharacterized protein n=1 Tax=Microcystis aeruginosa (strain NIES-843 / IAM M-2473) TaxID=449447 RepID=B0JP02_MICAN|nr:unknown protein [Microcystis aeruginosa NIES-843]